MYSAKSQEFFTEFYEMESGVLDLKTTSYKGPLVSDEDMTELVQYLQAHPEIYKLNLSGNKLSDKAAKILATITTILALDLSNNCLTDEGVFYLSQSKTLKCLDLSCNVKYYSAIYRKLGVKSAEYLSENNNIEVLIINNNELGPEGALQLAKRSSLICLEIALNNIGNEGFAYLGQNKHLLKINARQNNISDEGAISFAKNSCCEILNLSLNPIDDQGIIAIAGLSQLTNLNLSENKTFQEAGFKALAAAKNLKKLYVGYNEISTMSAIALVSNDTLEVLDFEHAGFGLFLPANILKEKNPITSANHVRAFNLPCNVPSLQKLSLFAVKQKNLCGFLKINELYDKERLQTLEHSYFILTNDGLYFLNGFDKNIEALDLDQEKIDKLCNLFRKKEIVHVLSENKLNRITTITGFQPPNSCPELAVMGF